MQRDRESVLRKLCGRVSTTEYLANLAPNLNPSNQSVIIIFAKIREVHSTKIVISLRILGVAQRNFQRLGMTYNDKIKNKI